MNGYSPTYVAAGSTVFVVIASWLNPDPRGRIGPRLFIESCTDTVYRIAILTGAVLGAGAIIGCIELSGLAGKFTLMMYYVAGDNVVLILATSAIVLILMGMGMPTPGVYIMGVALIAPVLVSDLWLPVLQAHLFMLYFACMSAITPPMATACFSAATIAEANPMVIAVHAVKQGIAGFILPFFFVFNPGVIGIGSTMEVVSALPIRFTPTPTRARMGANGIYGSAPWMFSTAPISHSRIRYPSSSDFSPMMRRVPPTWRKPAGETALPARTAARRESRSTLKTALASCAAASAARTPG